MPLGRRADGVVWTAHGTIQPVIGIIGGSGLYDIDGLEAKEWRRVQTPWGEPSDELLFGRLAASSACSCRAMAAATAPRRRT